MYINKLWPGQAQYMTILTFIWPLWPWPSTYLNKCFKWHFASSRTTTVQNYFWNPCINEPVMARTSSIIWPFWPLFDPCDLDLQTTYKKSIKLHFSSSRTTTVQNYFWNPCINAQVQVRTSLKYDHFNIWPLWPWPSTYLEKKIQIAVLLLEGYNCAKLFWNPCVNVQVMLQTSSIHVFDYFDLYLTPVTLTFNLLRMFQMVLFLFKGN